MSILLMWLLSILADNFLSLCKDYLNFLLSKDIAEVLKIPLHNNGNILKS